MIPYLGMHCWSNNERRIRTFTDQGMRYAVDAINSVTILPDL